MAGASWSLTRRFEEGVLGAVVFGADGRGRSVRWWVYPAIVAIAGAIYGAVMGSWSAGGEGRAWLVPYAAIKVPLVILATTLICLPGYFVLSTVLGLRSEFRAALGAIAAGQAGTTLALASLAPITRFVYVGGVGHAGALVLSAGMFTLAAGAGYAVMVRRYRPLVARTGKHRVMLAAWITMYVFVGIQMGWMLRPFVGTPGMGVTFVRQEPLSNAYVAVARIVVESVREVGGARGMPGR
jgi:hypothetical protein